MKLKSNLESLLPRLSLLPIAALFVSASGLPSVCAQELATTNANPVAASDGSSTVPAGNPQTFFSSVGNYLTSSNPNLPIHGQAEIGLGLAYQSGVNIASDLSARYKISVSTNSGVLLESVTRNAGVNGVIVSEQAGFGYYYIPSTTPDIEISAGFLVDIALIPDPLHLPPTWMPENRSPQTPSPACASVSSTTGPVPLTRQ